MIDFQVLFDVAMGLAGGLGGYILKSISDSIESLRNKDNSIEHEVHQIHVLVAGTYVKRDELHNELGAIHNVLRRIEDKIDQKQDKGGVK